MSNNSAVLPSLRRDLATVVSLSLPVVAAELGWMFMGVLDTIMVGPLGPSAIGAVSIGGIVFDVFAIFGIGLLLGLDTLVSQAWGAGDPESCRRSLWAGLYLALIATPLLLLALQSVPWLMTSAGVHSGVVSLAIPYLLPLNWSLAPLLLYAVFRRYLQSTDRPRVVMFALLSANIVNAIGNWFLIPRMGVEGAGWATFGSRVYMALVLAGYAIFTERRTFQWIGPEWIRIMQLLQLGLPAALQILLEVGVFATATVLAGRLRPEDLAAHHVVLNIIATTFMVPLGISSAAAVLVGQSIGRVDPQEARRLGMLAIALGAGSMALFGIGLAIFPAVVLGIFTRNRDILEVAVPLVGVAALFQIFDGTSITVTGALRGAGDTRSSMVFNLLGHWFLGLPVGYALCFNFQWGVLGLWTGLLVGLVAVGSSLFVRWQRWSSREFAH